MALDPRKRQKKQERRAAKRKSKLHQFARAQHAGMADTFAAAAKHPILHCWVSIDLWSQGMGWVGLSREQPNGSVAFAIFLIDRYCLGIKNALASIRSRFDYESRITKGIRADFLTEEINPPAARKLVERALEYAHGLGFHPHTDYHLAKLIFGDVEASACTEEFEFGKDGKPFFIAGPQDTPPRCQFILKTLEQRCGPDGFHYLIPWADSNFVLPETLQRGPSRVIGRDEFGVVREYDLDEAAGTP